MAQAAVANLAAAGIERPRDEQGQPLPIPNTADTGYYSAENVQGVAEAGLDPYFAVGRDKHHAPEADPCAAAPSGSADASPTPADLRRHRGREPEGRDGKEAPHGDRPRPVCGAETHRGTRVRPDQADPRLSQVPASGAGKRLRGMAIDLSDAQPAEDLETRLKRVLTFRAPRARRGHQPTSARTFKEKKDESLG